MDLFGGNCFDASDTTRPPFMAGLNTVGGVHTSERCDGMSVDTLVVNSSYLDDTSVEFDPVRSQGATNEALTSRNIQLQSSEPSNSERTLEKWEYLLRTRPRDPM